MFDCIILCAGSGTRTNLSYNKVLYKVNDKPLYAYSVDLFKSLKEVDKIVIVSSENDYDYFNNAFKNDKQVIVTIGGKERSDSVLAGLKKCDSEVVLIHDGARPNILKEEVLGVYEEAKKNKASVLAVKAKDTIKRVDDELYIFDTLNRSELMQMQTPQGVNREMMIEGLEKIDNKKSILDDVYVFEKVYGIKPKVVLGRYENIKVTTESDLDYIEFLLKGKDVDMSGYYRIGHSNDIHKLVSGRKLVLGGIEIPYELGLLGYSDADVVLHVVCESILGALGLCDIGTLFPDTDKKYKDMDSKVFVSKAYELMDERGYKINNIDIIIYIEKPMLSDYKPLMKECIASLLHTDVSNVTVKATRKEGMGYIGEGKAIEAESVVLLVRK